MGIIDKNMKKIKALFSNQKVSRFLVFGSLLTECQNQSGVINFVVNFSDADIYNYADNSVDQKMLRKIL